jgi:hypothetical protein
VRADSAENVAAKPSARFVAPASKSAMQADAAAAPKTPIVPVG